MKELSIEEKAKRYDEAIKRGLDYIRHTPATEMVTRQDIFETIFPELAESEDEEIRKAIYNCVKWFGFDSIFFKDVSQEECLAWLEKQGEQREIDYDEELKRCKANPIYFFDKYVKVKLKEQKPTWSEEDEENLKWFEKFFRAESVISGGKDIPQDRYLWFKNLKDRVQPQPKQEWSEEDETGLGDALWAIQQAKTIAKDENDMGNLWYAENWLKSLKDRVQHQSTWKPSEEMLEALYRVIPKNVLEISEDEMLLDKLYQGLKYGRVLSKK